MMTQQSLVSIVKSDHTDYPRHGPFSPVVPYPEYPFDDRDADGDNWAYGMVRESLAALGLDREHFGTPAWNPLGEILGPGQSVVIKPNLVISSHELGVAGLLASVTHAAVIRPVVDYALLAVGREGRIIVADSPIKETDFETITRVNGLADLAAFYEAQGVNFHLLDLRDVHAWRDARGVIRASWPLPGDPHGYRTVDLGSRSMLARVDPRAQHRYRSTASIYENETAKHHTATRNDYSMPASILEADALISVAKLKTHWKAGVTASLKNMIGTTNEKRWLPHHRTGTPSQGGDMAPDGSTRGHKLRQILFDLATRSRYGEHLQARVYPLLGAIYHRLMRRRYQLADDAPTSQDFPEGSWYGNDTIWRTILDLNMIVRYADRFGQLQETPQRTYLSLIDGVIGGEREGPLHPTPKLCGVVLAGLDPVAVDLVCARLMGFDFERIPTLARAHETPLLLGTNRPGDIVLASNAPELATWEELGKNNLGFIPPRAWARHVELPDEPVQPASPERAPAPV